MFQDFYTELPQLFLLVVFAVVFAVDAFVTAVIVVSLTREVTERYE